VILEILDESVFELAKKLYCSRSKYEVFRKLFAQIKRERSMKKLALDDVTFDESWATLGLSIELNL